MSEVKQCCLCGAVGHDSKDCGMRAQFERAYSDAYVRGIPTMSADDYLTNLQSLRDGDMYSPHLNYLNDQWKFWRKAWQAARAQPAEQQDCGMVLSASDVEFLAARMRRLCDKFGQPVSKRDNDQFVVGVAGSLIGLLLTHLEVQERNAQPAGEAVARKAGRYAIRYRDNWDGEGDICHLIAILHGDGSWTEDETGKKLLEYEGDEILQVWPLYTAPPVQVPELSLAAQDVLAERRRQVESEGWMPEHDDQHEYGQMASAAACYALTASGDREIRLSHSLTLSIAWPWDKDWWKPTTPRRNLIKAGALILAEIERIDRASTKIKKDG